MKFCRSCGRTSPQVVFDGDRRTRDRLRPDCRTCRGARTGTEPVVVAPPALVARVGHQLTAHRLRIEAAKKIGEGFLRRGSPTARDAQVAVRDLLAALDDPEPEPEPKEAP